MGQAFLHVCVLYQEVWDSRFALKVARDVEFGFGARCEAVAMTRRKQLPPFRAAPWYATKPQRFWAKGRTRGRAPDQVRMLSAGRSRRRTSGGEAVTKLVYDI